MLGVGRAVASLIRHAVAAAVDLLRRSGAVIGAAAPAIVHAVGLAAAAAGAATLWCATAIGAVLTSASVPIGRGVASLIRPVAGAAVDLLCRAAAVTGAAAGAVVHAAGIKAAALWAGTSWCARAMAGLMARGLTSATDALRPSLAAAAWAAGAAFRLMAGCCKLIWEGLAGAGSLAWAAACWARRRLLGPSLLGIGSIVVSNWRRFAAPLIGTLNRAALVVATGVGHASAALGGSVGRGARQAAQRLSRPIRAVGSAVRARRLAVAEGALVAFATARHHARKAGLRELAGEPGWRATMAQADALAPPVDQSITATFTTESFQNSFVAPGVSRVSAIVSVTAEDSGSVRTEPDVVELILVDCSASMAHPWEKIQAARNATRAAVEALRDGVWFAIVRGAESAEVVYPRREGLVRASPDTKRAAIKAIGSLQPVGGTAIGSWLTLAADLMSLRPDAIHHAILLTDGKDEDETEAELDTAIARCEGVLQCDCRGVGTDWAVSELRKIATALLGSLDIIRDPAAMEAEFRLMTEAAMARQLEVSLRVWIPNHARINFVRQVSPSILDLTARGRAAGPLITDYLTGAWGSERREYHVSIDVRPGQVGAEMLASRVSVLVRNNVVAKALVKAIWTEDDALTAPLSPEVAHYAGQAELARAIQEGLEALRDRNEELANRKLGRAAQLAVESGNNPVAGLIANVVDVVDAATGKVRMRRTVDRSDEMALDTRSTKTVRISSSARLAAEPQLTSDA